MKNENVKTLEALRERESISILELFGGIGACTKALKNIGMNVNVVDYVEIDKYACKSYNAINGTNFEPQDIKEWDKDINIDLIMHGSPCFLAGERVNTKNGFKNIENIQIGDIVKSHNGTYNKVTQIMKSYNSDIFDISCSATHNINTTFNHPFYILRENNKEWIEAKDLTTKDFMCIPINKNENEINISNTKLPMRDFRFWYLIGRFIGDGWVTTRKERNNNISGIKICCAKNELEELKLKLDNILHYCVVEDKTTYKLQFSNKELGEFCKQFGIGAKNKNIPQWILDLKKEYLEYLLFGIIDSDGCFSQNRYKVTTISRNLAYNIGELVLKIKNVPYHIYKNIRPKKYNIEGRIVNQNDTYQITWGFNYNHNINFVDNNYLYSKIRKIEEREEFNDVYNIEVEDTHSYCVNNIATHNCQDFSIAGKQAGGDEDSGTRSSLMYETIRIIEKLHPKYIIWENVKNLLSKKHKHNFDNYINKLDELGYNSYYQVLNAKDYSIPQNRERVYTISIRKDINNDNFKFPEKEELKLRLKDILEDEVDKKYYLNDKQLLAIKNSTYMSTQRRIQEKDYCDTLCARDFKDPKCVRVGNLDIKGIESIKRVYSPEGISPTLTTCGGGNRQVKIKDGNNIRKLVPLEYWRLMSFDDEDFYKAQNVGISNSQLYKQAGNSIVVKVLEKIFLNLFKGD